jgi:hypothetical protein
MQGSGAKPQGYKVMDAHTHTHICFYIDRSMYGYILHRDEGQTVTLSQSQVLVTLSVSLSIAAQP